MSPSAAAGAVKRLQSSSPCGGHTGKHHFRVHSFMSGQASILRCSWTACQKFKVIAHEDLVAAVVA